MSHHKHAICRPPKNTRGAGQGRICEGDLLIIVSGTPSTTCLPLVDIMLKLTEQMIRARAATACLYGLVDCITCCKASAHMWQELGMQRSAQLMGGALANILGNYVLQRLFALLGERLSTHKQKMLATSPPSVSSGAGLRSSH